MPSPGEIMANTIDGRRCLAHVRELSRYDRSLGSRGYHEAAEYVLATLGRLGLERDVVTWPMDNTPVPWNWDVPYAWEPHAGLFKVLSPEEKTLVNFFNTPTCIHPWSAATPPEGVTAEIVYVGNGTSDEDYEGKDVRGKIVFADRGATWLVYLHAIEKRGALGYISDDILAIPHVKTREQYPDMVLWYTFFEREFGSGGRLKGWGLSISPRMGDYLRGLLAQGPVTGYCQIDARTFDGVMENVLGTIEGEELPEEEFLCMAHLDHYRPGAMDNNSGCAVLLEAADSINRLIKAGTLPRPRRSIRFLFGPEGHMSNVYPHSLGEDVRNIIGSWTADTVGARPHVVGGPLILTRASAATPTFLNDLGVHLLKESCHWYTALGSEPQATGVSSDSLIQAQTGTSPFKFEVLPYGIHSDNSCIAGWGVPAVGIFQWPSTIWHAQYDTVDKLDPGEMARCAWATAVMSYQVAAAGPRQALAWMYDVASDAQHRLGAVARRARQEMLAADAAATDSFVERLEDELRYNAERDSQAIASCLTLVRHDAVALQSTLRDQAEQLSEKLFARAEAEARALRDMAGSLSTLDTHPS
ncbi:MAG: M28 family peptidase [Ardenticatenaceae bacterium]|nr:M28 family peptidase [Ardenticatenaceae bacterium]